jgi:hypothetical protein
MRRGLGFHNRRSPGLFSPYSLFYNGEQGAWYDPSDVNVNWRRNLLTYTEDYSAAVWLKTISTITPNTTLAPDGSVTADTLTAVAGAGFHYARGIITFLATSYTYSVYVKKGTSRWIFFGVSDSTLNYFDLDTGTFGTTSATCTVSALASGWYRITATEVRTAVIESGVNIGVANGNGGGSFTANGTETVIVWGAQLELGSTATAYQQIVTPEITYLSTIQTQPILYQDSAGTTPVTAIEQPVGLMLDKSKGLVLGSELVTNGDFSSGTTGWALGAGWSITGGQAVASVPGGFTDIRGTSNITAAGKWYRLTFNVTVTAGGIRPFLGGVTYTPTITTSGFYSILINATSANYVAFIAWGDFTGTLDNVSVKELPGNHAFQTNNTKRPVLSARVNLLTKTEDFADAVWTKSNTTVSANAGVAPNGTTTAELVYPTTTGLDRTIYQAVTSASVAATVSFSAKANGKSWIWVVGASGTSGSGVFFNVSTGVKGTERGGHIGTIVPEGNGWYRVTVTCPVGTVLFAQITIVDADNSNAVTANGTDGVLLWGADLRPTNVGVNLPPYQYVNTATDYATSGFPLYLKADGVDDAMTTNSVDFSGTNKITTWAGVRKLSDGAGRMLFELSVAADLNNGFFVTAPSGTSPSYGTGVSCGTYVAISAGGAPAPDTSVLSTQANAATPVLTLRRNGSVFVTDSSSQGAGNYSNNPLFLFARNQTSLYFNGNCYGMIIRGAASTAEQISATEQWLNQRTFAY